MSNNTELSKNEFRWIRDPNQKGKFLFTFDGETVFSLFKDYPDNLTKEQKELFDTANPFWVNYFKDRTESNL